MSERATRVTRVSRSNPVAVAVAALCALCASTAATADPVRFEINAGNAAESLAEVSKQSGLQMLFVQEAVEGRMMPAIAGRFEPEVALKRLLADSGLTFRFVNDRTVTILDSTKMPEGTSTEKTGSLRGIEKALHIARDDGRSQVELSPSPQPISLSDSSGNEAGKLLEEIVVTGTHIRGVAPVGSPLIVIDRETIQASGHSRVQDLLEELPQNFRSVAEDSGTDRGAANSTRGQGVDLRGLGASTTLVLINGRRQPAGGTEGGFVDISSIATSAVERIEILPDGASALYGSDAIGGVINFILRKDYKGFETGLRIGTTDGAADEWQASQLWGRNWADGNLLVGYQYSRRNVMSFADTPYGSMNGDFRSRGGTDFRLPGGTPGTILDPATGQAAYAIPAGQDGTNLDSADLLEGQANYRDYTRASWLPEYTQHSAFFTLSQQLGPSFEAFLEGRYSRRKTDSPSTDYGVYVFVPSSNPFFVNPFGTDPVNVAYDLKELGATTQGSDTETYSVTAGGIADLGRKWKLNVAATYGRERNSWQWLNTASADRIDVCLSGLPGSGCPGAPLNVFGDGSANDATTLDFIRDTEQAWGTSQIGSLTAIADGPLLQLPAGEVKLAVGLDYRDEQLDARRGSLAPATGVFTPPTNFVGDLDRNVSAAFAEMVVPILGRDRSLELSLAGRYEDYSDFGTTLNPKIGIRFVPLASLSLRASWGTSFRAPSFNELSPTANVSRAFGFPVPDPKSPTGFSNALVVLGVSPDIHEETADIWTAGFDFSPTRLPELSISASYFKLDYEGKIQDAFDATSLELEDQWAEVITRNPTTEQIDAICNGSNPFFGSCPSNIAVIIDTSLRNLGGVRVSGIDFDLGYRPELSLGRLNLGLRGTYTLKYDQANSPSAPFFDVLDTPRNPLALRMQGIAGWDFKEWAVHVTVNHAGSYHNPADPTVLNRKVHAWTTVNSGASYRFSSGGRLDGARVQLSAINLFDKAPPFVNAFDGFDPANGNEAGRSMSLSVSKAW